LQKQQPAEGHGLHNKLHISVRIARADRIWTRFRRKYPNYCGI